MYYLLLSPKERNDEITCRRFVIAMSRVVADAITMRERRSCHVGKYDIAETFKYDGSDFVTDGTYKIIETK